jgi:hypothetical protein
MVTTEWREHWTPQAPPSGSPALPGEKEEIVKYVPLMARQRRSDIFDTAAKFVVWVLLAFGLAVIGVVLLTRYW